MRRRVSIALAGAVALLTLQSIPLWAGESVAIGRIAVPAVGELESWLTPVGRTNSLASLNASGTTTLLQQRRGGSGHVLEDRHWRRRRHRDDTMPESYLILKGGGLHVSEEPSTEGIYVGGEIGGSVESVVDFGFTLDYFYRSSSEMLVLSESQANDLPVRAEMTLEQSSAHLVPIGLTVRARVPLGNDRVTPFISGTLAYEILYLQNDGTLDPSDPIQAILEADETFTGFGWQAATGVNIGLSPSFGLFGEVGLHRSSPKQEIELDGVPVDLKVDLDGAFLRGGLRVTL